MKKMDNKAQGSQMMVFLFIIIITMFIFADAGIRSWIEVTFNSVFYPLIGFDGNFPIITIVLAGIIVVFLSSFFQNLFTDYKKMGEAQEIMKAYQAEMRKATKEGNTNRVNKLRKMQPQIMKKQTEVQSNSMKPMMFLFIFIVPIFIWLRYFLSNLPYYYFTVPWAKNVSFFDNSILWQSWLWIYLIFSMIIGQLLRAGFKYISWSDWWQNIRGKNKPTFNQ